MSEKRKLTTRATASKKRKSESTPPESVQKAPTPKSATPVVEDGILPKAHTAGKPLPTVSDPQPEDLSSREFQSVAESGVLADSLLRSKQKWISEGIFERYWTKPVKKKKEDAIEPPNNPAKESMTKLGTCIITIEPHVFDATMYAVKNPAVPLPHIPQQASRPILQYGPPGGIVQQHQPHPSTLQTQFSSSTQDSKRPVNGPTPGTPANGASNAAQNPPAAQPASGAPTPKSTDPVIQMLAERAATDQNLKALMRIVAGGNASPDELKQFQSHIDDLTRLLQSRPRLNSQLSNGQSGSPGPRPANGLPTPPPQPQALRSKGPVPSKPDISAVVFEFAGGSGDRFLFPKYSILEYLPGNQIIASFLIVRKGTPEDSPYYDPQLDYYQPVTIRIFAQQGRQLDTLGKVVAPQEEVRRYMDDIMDNMTRAEYVLLAMRLPKEKEPLPEPEPAPNMAAMPPVMWVPTPNAIVPISKSKLYQQAPLNEEQMYQGFISTVS